MFLSPGILNPWFLTAVASCLVSREKQEKGLGFGARAKRDGGEGGFEGIENGDGEKG